MFVRWAAGWHLTNSNTRYELPRIQYAPPVIKDHYEGHEECSSRKWSGNSASWLAPRRLPLRDKERG